MRIAYVTIYDSLDILRGSGTFYYLGRALENQGHVVYRVGPFDFRIPLLTRLLSAIHRRLGKRYIVFLDPFVAPYTARQAQKALADVDYDIVLTNDLAIASALDVVKPIIIYTDAMITKNYDEAQLPHSRVSNLSWLSLRLCQYTIKKALKNATVSIFPVEWSYAEAKKYVPDAAVEIVNFGANIEAPPESIIDTRISIRESVQLLFVGKEWLRKGGDIAVKTVKALHDRGRNAHLHIVGGIPPYETRSDLITVYGLLSKASEGERKKLLSLFAKCDVFILPSQSEGFVISVLEAAAFAMPSIAYRAMGVEKAVQDGNSGVLLPLGASAEVFADVIEEWMDTPAEYQTLARGARKHYESSVNWATSVKKLGTIIHEYIR